MDPQLATMAAQFGVAGLIGWMWLTERRAAADRDKQLADAQSMLAQSQKGMDVLLKALDDNTRAITALEAAQRSLIQAFTRAGPTPAPKEPLA
jgi:hypothetical protein